VPLSAGPVAGRRPASGRYGAALDAPSAGRRPAPPALPTASCFPVFGALPAPPALPTASCFLAYGALPAPPAVATTIRSCGNFPRRASLACHRSRRSIHDASAAHAGSRTHLATNRSLGAMGSSRSGRSSLDRTTAAAVRAEIHRSPRWPSLNGSIDDRGRGVAPDPCARQEPVSARRRAGRARQVSSGDRTPCR
jgi:hypothetical protein